jgi:MATE family multidrug resistance protein
MTLRDLRTEFPPMLRLAAPLILAEVGWMAMGIVDTMVVGRVNAEAIAAVSLGTVIFYGLAMFAGGLLMGLDTLVSQAFGAGDERDARHSLISGVWLALALIVPVMAAVWAFFPLLDAIGVDPAVSRATKPYMSALNWSAGPLLIYFALRRYLQAVNVVRPIMITLITANLVNLAVNWVLVFGNLGAPAMGARGSGWATCFARIYMLIVMGAVLWRREGSTLLAVSWRPDFTRIGRLAMLGFPVAVQMILEIGVFALVTMLIGRLGAQALAGHQIAINTVSMTFMLPLGVSSAAAVRVGQALGARDAPGAARAGWTALGLAIAIMSVAALTLEFAPHEIARAFTPNVAIIATAVSLLRVAAFFQLFDGCQIVATGALRGAGDTRTPMVCHFLGYWVIGMPLGAWLCFHLGKGAVGLWTGLTVGLVLIGAVLVELWRRATHVFAMSGSRDDAVFRDALQDLRGGSFSRLAPLFEERAGARARIIDWFEEGRFNGEPIALAEALTCACFLGQTGVADYLLTRGVDPSAGIGTGLNAFHWAANRGQLDAVRLLVRRKAPLETRSMYDGTVLGTAVWSAINEPRRDHLQIIEELLAAGARMEEVDYPTGNSKVDAVLRRAR